MNPSLVSVIIPAYNAENYIGETIASVVGQTYTNWELIVVDDGSTDHTGAIIDDWTAKDKRIFVLHKANTGVSDSRNKGIERAKGEYVAFLDADDTMRKENIELKLNLMNKQPDLDWVFSDTYLINENSTIIGEMIGIDDDFLKNLLLWEGKSIVPCPCSNALIKEKCIETIRFDTQFSTAADQDFVFCLSKKFKGKRINQKLLHYRVLPNSMSRNIALMEKDHIAVYKKTAKNGLFHSFWFRKRCFSNLYLVLAGSWWVNGKNKSRGIYFMLRSVMAYPPTVFRLIGRLFTKLLMR